MKWENDPLDFQNFKGNALVSRHMLLIVYHFSQKRGDLSTTLEIWSQTIYF